MARSSPKLYNPRHPERTLLYHTVAEHYETWLDLARAGQSGGLGDIPVKLGHLPTMAEYHAAMGIVNKDGAAIYKYLNFDQI